ncbi:MAG: flagellar hook-basal body complex protein [Rhodobacteraceae bacterium]|nr:MAG: flagellar hook-basal body complex protein [Paracoccaceae bacterium]
MDNPGYVALTRMRGLADELRVVANNVANLATVGFRGEQVVFAEVLVAADVDGGALAMAAPRAHVTDPSPGGFRPTGGALDIAIAGDGYFQVQTPEGVRLTRAGAFSRSVEGLVVNAQGHALLDAGGAPIGLPPDMADIHITEDGTVTAEGEPVAQIGLVTADPLSLVRLDGVLFRADGDVEEDAESRVMQGFLEESNVSPVAEIARLIEVQRAYELGQSLLDLEDQRIREAVRTLGRSA